MSFNSYSSPGSTGNKTYDLQSWDGRPFTKPALKIIRTSGSVSIAGLALELGIKERHAREVIKLLEIAGDVAISKGLVYLK